MLVHNKSVPPHHTMNLHTGAGSLRKRKAESQDNERLSKRMSLLNIEKGGTKLYVPVENPSHPNANTPNSDSHYTSSWNPQSSSSTTKTGHLSPTVDSVMDVEDSKYKVYIYNLDDELSSSSDSEVDEGRLVFLPDIEKHLSANRIPPSVLCNSDGELAGMQLVLYREPTSLTIPKEEDCVRRAVMETRERFRERQRLERLGDTQAVNDVQMMPMADQPVESPITCDAPDVDDMDLS